MPRKIKASSTGIPTRADSLLHTTLANSTNAAASRTRVSSICVSSYIFYIIAYSEQKVVENL